MCKNDEGIVMPNFAAFSVIYKKPPGGGYPPPVGARVKGAGIRPLSVRSWRIDSRRRVSYRV